MIDFDFFNAHLCIIDHGECGCSLCLENYHYINSYPSDKYPYQMAMVKQELIRRASSPPPIYIARKSRKKSN